MRQHALDWIVWLVAWAWLVAGCGGNGSPGPDSSSRKGSSSGSGSSLASLPTDRVLVRLGARATRREAAWELGRRKAKKAVGPLLGHIDDKDARIQVAALWALGEIGDKKAIQYVRTKLTDREPDVRLAAAVALGKMPDAQAALWLAEQSRDVDRRVRLAVVRALTRTPEPIAMKAAVQALDDRDAAVADAAAEGLAQAGRPALRAIEQALERLAPAGRLRAAGALGKMKRPDAAPALIRAMALAAGPRAQGDPQVRAKTRAAAQDALARIGEPALPALTRAAIHRHGNLALKRDAAKVLVRIGKPAVAPVAKHVLAWKVFPNAEELKLWAEVLEAIGGDDPQAQTALKRARAQLAQAPGDEVPGGPSSRAATPPGGAEIGTVVEPVGPPASPIEIPPSPTEMPATGLVRLVLHGGLARTDRPGQAARKDLEIELIRHRGKWTPSVVGKSVTFNQGDHEGMLLSHREGNPTRLRVEMLILDDNWVSGGFGVYDIELDRSGGRFAGTYRGRFNGRNVEGKTSVSFQQWPAVASLDTDVQSGEHPRLLFRKRHLPAMRRKARTEFGRRIVKAVQARLTAEQQNTDHAVGWGLLYALLEDAKYGRQAIPLIRAGIHAGSGGHIHGSARKLLPIALAYDLAYNCMTADERKEFNEYVVGHGAALGIKGLGNNCLSANSNWCAISFGPAVVGCLAGLREKFPFDLKPPKEVPAVTTVPAEPAAPPAVGVPVVKFHSGELIKGWLAAGPFQADANQDPLAELGGRASARPQAGIGVTWRGKRFAFAPLPKTAVRKAPSFIPVPPEIRLPAAKGDSRSYLYALLAVERRQGAKVACSNAPDRKPVHLWINGRRFADGDIVVLQPGTHRLLLEVVGPAACPRLTAVDPARHQALRDRYRRLRDRWQAAKAAHAASGESARIRRGLTVSSRHVGRWFRYALGDHAWKSEPEGYHAMSLDMVLPAAATYRTVMGREIVHGTGLPWVVPLGLLRTCAGGGGGYSNPTGRLSHSHLCYALHLAPRELRPALVWEFNRRFLPDRLDQLSCQELAFAFVHYPLDVRPQEPEKVMPKVIADRRKGAFVFRNRFRDADDIVTHVFFRSERPNGPSYFHQQAGSFRISGLGTAWAVGAAGDKRNWQYAQENVAHVEPSNGHGLGSVRHFSCRPDGSGVLAADMSDVHNARTQLGVRASRHFAVDYGGRSGAAALFAVADRIEGGGTKSWLLHTGAGPIRVEASTFHVQGRKGGAGTSLSGRFVAPADVRLEAAGSTLKAVSTAKRADYFVVMTLQRGPAPECVVTGSGLDATVRVGEQEVRFDGQKLVLKH